MEKYNKSKIAALDQFVKSINYSLIKDKEVRNMLIRLIPQTARRLKEIDEDRKALFEKFIEVFPQDRRIAYDEANRARMEALRKFEESHSDEDKKVAEKAQNDFVNEYKDMLEAVDDFNKAVNEIMNEDTDLSVDSVDIEKFMDAMEDQSFDITAETFEMLDPLVRFSDPNTTE